jgi:multisubunit Na+/H+ antiporter MnhG subunit
VRRLYEDGTRFFGILLCVLGVILIVSALARGGGPLAVGVVIGTLFVLLGAGRLVLAGGRR